MIAAAQSIRLDHLTVDYGEGPVVDELDLKLDAGELTALLGPSGCGKTTTLRVIAGLLQPTSGRVYFDNDDVTDLPPWSRRLGLVFQNHSLFPHLTVLENVMYGLAGRGRSKAERAARARAVLELTHIGGMGSRRPSELSGGQSQRVALARALAPEPRLLLLDEPFSSLDADLREKMRVEVAAIVREVGVTTLLVTHDQEEALSMADRVVVMNEGRVLEYGGPGDVYQRPRSIFGARFVGNSNVLPGRLCETGNGYALAVGTSLLALPSAPQPGIEYAAAIKPEEVLVGTEVALADTCVDAELVVETYQGMTHESVWRLDAFGGVLVRARHRAACGQAVGETGCVGWQDRDLRLVSSASSAGL